MTAKLLGFRRYPVPPHMVKPDLLGEKETQFVLHRRPKGGFGAKKRLFSRPKTRKKNIDNADFC